MFPGNKSMKSLLIDNPIHNEISQLIDFNDLFLLKLLLFSH